MYGLLVVCAIFPILALGADNYHHFVARHKRCYRPGSNVEQIDSAQSSIKNSDRDRKHIHVDKCMYVTHNNHSDQGRKDNSEEVSGDKSVFHLEHGASGTPHEFTQNGSFGNHHEIHNGKDLEALYPINGTKGRSSNGEHRVYNESVLVENSTVNVVDEVPTHPDQSGRAHIEGSLHEIHVGRGTYISYLRRRNRERSVN